MVNIFPCVCWPSGCLPLRSAYSGSLSIFLTELFVLLMLNYMSSLYILETNSLSDKSFANVFSYSVDYIFTLLMVFFAVQSFLVWYSPTCLFLLLLPLPREICPKKMKSGCIIPPMFFFFSLVCFGNLSSFVIPYKF